MRAQGKQLFGCWCGASFFLRIFSHAKRKLNKQSAVVCWLYRFGFCDGKEQVIFILFYLRKQFNQK